MEDLKRDQVGHTNLKGSGKANEDNSERHDESSRVEMKLFDGGARTLTAATDGRAGGIYT